MIIGFEEITAPLADAVIKDCLPVLISKILHDHTEKMKGIKNAQIKEYLLETTGHKLCSVKTRDLIHHLRVSYRCTIEGKYAYLCATKHGYYFTTNEHEIISFRESLRQRVASIMEIFHSIAI